MNWVRKRAYQDGQFLLAQLLSQVSEDVREFNRLPQSIHHRVQMYVNRHDSRLFTISVHRDLTPPIDLITFEAVEDSIITTDPYPHVIQAREIDGEIQWILNRADFAPRTLEEITESILEAPFFG